MRTTTLKAAISLAALSIIGCETESSGPPTEEASDATTEVTDSGQSSTGPPESQASPVRVARVLDGDTIDLRNGKRIQLVQIDSPESDGECYGDQAGQVLSKILPAGTKVVLERDPALDDVDRYGRLLRYIHEGGTNVNLLLVKRGAASVWFFDGDRGRYADELLAAARAAKADGRGAWGDCRAKLDPNGPFDPRPKKPIPPPPGPGGGGCMAGYSPCLPIRGDLDCDDLVAMGKAPVRVRGSDPYGLDGDNDGVGCE